MTSENKKILIVGAGELQIPLIQAAKELGLFVAASDQNPDAPGFAYADAKIIADTMNPQESLEKIISFTAQNGPIHGVATAGTDASLTVATIANHFHLPGHGIEAARRASNKKLMCETLESAGVSIPKFHSFSTLHELRQLFKGLNSPCVVKPINNMGARGTSLVRKDDELEAAFQLVEKYSSSNEYLIEEYIDAPELSIDALVFNHTVTITGIADRIIEYTPYFVETGHILPSNLPQEWIDRALITFRDAIKALGLKHGAAKIDIKVSAERAWVIEIAARLSGGYMSSHTFPAATGIPLHRYMVMLSMGEQIPSFGPTKNLVSIERAIIAPPGKIIGISIPENILQQEFITNFSMRAKAGDISVSPKNNLDKAGSIIATAPSRLQAIHAVNKAIKSIKFTVEPEYDLQTYIRESEDKARILLKGTCNVCRTCDGLWCRGQIPGVGGVGTGEGFIQSYQRYRELKLVPTYIHNVRTVDTSIEMFGQKHSIPVFTAPIGGVYINYNNASTELEFQRALIKGAYQAGTMGFIADPAPLNVFSVCAQAILENFGHCIPICKPRTDLNLIKERFTAALEAGALGIGTDIDGIGLRTFTLAGQGSCPKTIDELREISRGYKVPFVIKGILSVHDALSAVDAGATHIIVSSHGGRINEAFPCPIDVLPAVKKAVGNRAAILIDGAIRSGADVVKALILGADAVLIGRPAAYHAIGNNVQGVRAYLLNIKKQIETTMLLMSASSIEDIKNNSRLLIDMKSRI